MTSGQTVSAKEMGSALWQFCCSLSDDFDKNLGPEFRAKGFLRDSAENRTFLVENVLLHFWIIWSALDGDKDVLEVFNAFFINADMTQNQGRASEVLRDRFALYNEAFRRDQERLAQGQIPRYLRSAALQCLLSNGNLDESKIGWSVGSATGIRLWTTFPEVRKFRAQFRIRGA